MAYSASATLSGKRVINTFLQAYYEKNGFPLNETVLMQNVTTGDKDLFLKILGSAFENALESDQEKLDSAMKNLADETNAKIPLSSAFFEAMNGEIGGFKVYTQALTESAKEISSGIQFVGEQALATGKILTYLMPILAVVAVWYVGKNYLDKARV